MVLAPPVRSARQPSELKAYQGRWGGVLVCQPFLGLSNKFRVTSAIRLQTSYILHQPSIQPPNPSNLRIIQGLFYVQTIRI